MRLAKLSATLIASIAQWKSTEMCRDATTRWEPAWLQKHPLRRPVRGIGRAAAPHFRDTDAAMDAKGDIPAYVTSPPASIQYRGRRGAHAPLRCRPESDGRTQDS